VGTGRTVPKTGDGSVSHMTGEPEEPSPRSQEATNRTSMTFAITGESMKTISGEGICFHINRPLSDRVARHRTVTCLACPGQMRGKTQNRPLSHPCPTQLYGKKTRGTIPWLHDD
jgi:hypothetical protein